MRTKIFSALVMAFLILFATFQAEAAKKAVAILPLENVSGYTQANVSQIMTEQLIDVIHNSGQYTVIETTQMAAVLRQQGFENLVAGKAVDFGNKTGSDYTVVGKILLAQTTENTSGILQLFGALAKAEKAEKEGEEVNGMEVLEGIVNMDSVKGKVELQVRFVDNKTGEIVFVKTFSGEKAGKDGKEVLVSACHEASEKFLKELQATNPFAATVVAIDNQTQKIYIDQGSASGLQPGEVVMIAREVEPINVNGKVIGMKTVSICTARVLEVNAEYSICLPDGNIFMIQKGDVVKRG